MSRERQPRRIQVVDTFTGDIYEGPKKRDSKPIANVLISAGIHPNDLIGRFSYEQIQDLVYKVMNTPRGIQFYIE